MQTNTFQTIPFSFLILHEMTKCEKCPLSFLLQFNLNTNKLNESPPSFIPSFISHSFFTQTNHNTQREMWKEKEVSTLPPHNTIERRLQHKQQILVFHITWKMMLKSLLSNNSSITHSQCLINQCAFTTHCSNKTPSTLTQLQFIHFYHVCSTWCSQHKSPHHTTLIHPHSSFHNSSLLIIVPISS